MKYLLNSLNKKIIKGSTKTKGTNFSGKICVRHRGGGGPKQYRLIDWNRRLNQFGRILHTSYDPNRNATLGFILFQNGFLAWHILTEQIVAGHRIFAGDPRLKNLNFNLSIQHFYGYTLPLEYFPLFSVVSNVEGKLKSGSKLARSAGAQMVLVAQESGKSTLKSKSGWLLTVSNQCLATSGSVSNSSYKNVPWVKAGKSRGMGRRPVVRGVAMNPCDHPHGGGEGKKGSPRRTKTPWGKLTKGPHTKNTKKDKIKRRLFLKIR